MATEKMTAKDVSILRTGDQIIVPKGMALREAREWLRRKEEDEEKTIAINEEIDGYPLDGAHALVKVLQEKYGFISLAATPGFFGSRPPMMIGVEVGVNKSVQVPWGRIQIPNIEGFLQTGIAEKDGRPIFLLAGEVKQKHRDEIAELAQRTRDFLKTGSIYRGKAVRVSFPDEQEFDPKDCPKFMDVSKVTGKELVFPEETSKLVKTALFNPIRKTARCRKYRIPLKRGVLLEGPYGVGKTLTAYVAAKLCEDHQWTFLYLDKVKDLKKAIHFAQQYQPAVIFAEDIDRVLGGTNRNDEMNEILNAIDGVDTKAAEIIVVLTTNHVEQINPAMLRPGRLDTVINVRPPDAEAAVSLVRMYGADIIPEDEDLTAIGKKLAGLIPAVIREIVERSKLAAIGRDEDDDDAEMIVRSGDLEVAADGMLAHLNLMKPKDAEPSDFEKVADVVGKHLMQGMVKAAKHMPTNGASKTASPVS